MIALVPDIKGSNRADNPTRENHRPGKHGDCHGLGWDYNDGFCKEEKTTDWRIFW